MIPWEVQVFGTGIKITTNVPFSVDYFFPEATTDTTLYLLLLEGRLSHQQYNAENSRLIAMHPSIGGHLLRQLVAVLVGFNCRTHLPVHGSGFVVNNKGILAVGNRQSGKSTVANMIDDSIVMDDDILMIERDSMHVVGKHGSVCIPQQGRKNLRYLDSEGAIRTHSLDIVLLLDKRLPGGYLEYCDHTIPREYSVLDALPHLRKQYMQMPPFTVDAPVFLFGTDGGIEKTRESLGRIVER